MSDLISILSEIRSQYNFFDPKEEPYYHALSEAIGLISAQPEQKNEKIFIGNGTYKPDVLSEYLRLRNEKLPSAQPDVTDINIGDTISRQAAIALAKDICVPTKDGTVYKYRCIDPDAIKDLPPVQEWLEHGTLTADIIDFVPVKKGHDTVNIAPEREKILSRIKGGTAEEIYDSLHWLMFEYAIQYTDSRAAVINWLKGAEE